SFTHPSPPPPYPLSLHDALPISLSATVSLKARNVSSAQRSQLKSAARIRPLRRRRSLRSESSNARRMVSPISSMERGSKYSKTPPEISGMQEPFEATVGTPHAIASTMGRQKPSYKEGMTHSDAFLTRIAI